MAMVFSDDSDLLRVQPYVFEQGIASFALFHGVAADELVRDLKRYWLGALHAISVDLPTWWDSTFDPAKLNPAQWKSAAVYRVLGWHVLPLLASSVGGAGFVEMMQFYRSSYVQEFADVVQTGLEYNLGGGFVVVNRRSVAELQRLQR